MITRVAIAVAFLAIWAAPVLAATPAERLVRRPDSWYQGQEGRDALENILSWQSVHGGWPKNVDATSQPYSGDRDRLQATFDNGATSGELRVLARAISATGDDRYKQSFLRGLAHVLEAQYPHGGWPQRFPPGEDYHRHITLNDNTMIRLMEFLRDVATHEEFEFLDTDRRRAAQQAVDRGIECLLKCQVVVDGTLTVWCAQHDATTLAPTSARSFERESLSGAESAGVLRFLMEIDKPTPEVVRAVKAGVAWFDATKIEGYRYQRRADGPSLIPDPSAGPLWARFYEIGSNRPLFCDRDGVIKYDIEEIGVERRTGYSWYGDWGEAVARAYAEWPHQ